MSQLHAVLGFAVMASALAAGSWGAWRWYRAEPRSPAYWRLLRTSQVVLVVETAHGGLLVALGRTLPELHLLYGLLPLAVAFIAEQLRVASAETILAQKGIPDAQAVGRLPAGEQRFVVLAILRRELGVTAFGALVIAALAARAGFSAY